MHVTKDADAWLHDVKPCKSWSYFFLKRLCKPYGKSTWIKLYHSFDCNCLLNKPHNTITQTWTVQPLKLHHAAQHCIEGQQTGPCKNKVRPMISHDSETEWNLIYPSLYISAPSFIRDQTTYKLFFVKDAYFYYRTFHKVTEVLYETLQYFAIENIHNKIPLVNPWSLAGQLKLAQVFSESNSQAVIKYHKLLLQTPCYCPP